MGIEPTLSAWKAEVLPLNYTRASNDKNYCIIRYMFLSIRIFKYFGNYFFKKFDF